VAVTESLSPSLITVGSESFLNFQKLLLSIHMWCDTPESMTHFRAASEASGKAEYQSVSQCQVIERAAVAVPCFTLHHFFIQLYETQSTLR